MVRRPRKQDFFTKRRWSRKKPTNSMRPPDFESTISAKRSVEKLLQPTSRMGNELVQLVAMQ
jgi:hypothetical protein